MNVRLGASTDAEHTPSSDGRANKPPKDSATIRAALESVHAQSNAPATGPAQGGLSDGEEIVLERFHDSATARILKQWFSDAGIGFRERVRRGERVIYVDVDDRQRAAELLAVLHREHPEPPRPRIRRAHDMLLFGLVIGGSVGIVFGVGTQREELLVGAIVAFAFAGGLFGFLLDRLRAILHRTARGRVGLLEFLILVTLPMILLTLYKLAWTLIVTN